MTFLRDEVLFNDIEYDDYEKWTEESKFGVAERDLIALNQPEWGVEKLEKEFSSLIKQINNRLA